MSLWVSSPPDGEPKRYARGALAGHDVLERPRCGSRRTARRCWPGCGATPAQVPRRVLGDPACRAASRARPGVADGPGRVPPLFSWLPDNRHIVAACDPMDPTPGTHLWLADTSPDVLHPLTATAGNERAPSVSPDGRTIAFDSQATDFDLVEVPLDGSPLRPFLSSTRNEFDPAASPVNTQYAFVTDRTGALQIWLQNEEGYLQQPLVTEADFGGARSMAVGSLAFSPDGQRLAFQARWKADKQRLLADRGSGLSSVTGGTPVPLGGDSEPTRMPRLVAGRRVGGVHRRSGTGRW